MELELPNEIKQSLIQIIDELGSFEEGDSENGIVKGGRTENGSYFIHFEFGDSEIKNFKKYLNSLDDEIFLEACERYKAVNGAEAFEKMDNYMKTNAPEILELMEDFKGCVRSVIKGKIKNLETFL